MQVDLSGFFSNPNLQEAANKTKKSFRILTDKERGKLQKKLKELEEEWKKNQEASIEINILRLKLTEVRSCYQILKDLNKENELQLKEKEDNLLKTEEAFESIFEKKEVLAKNLNSLNESYDQKVAEKEEKEVQYKKILEAYQTLQSQSQEIEKENRELKELGRVDLQTIRELETRNLELKTQNEILMESMKVITPTPKRKKARVPSNSSISTFDVS